MDDAAEGPGLGGSTIYVMTCVCSSVAALIRFIWFRLSIAGFLWPWDLWGVCFCTTFGASTDSTCPHEAFGFTEFYTRTHNFWKYSTDKMDSPPSSTASRRASMDSMEGLDDYFANYVPLSSLPTPPEPVGSDGEEGCRNTRQGYGSERLRDSYYGPSLHLANLIPSGVCLHRPSPSAIQSYLQRCMLPLETIALAGCVLDSLSLKFSRKIREAFAAAHIAMPSSPEILVLASLALATSYLADDHLLASYWTGVVAQSSVTAQQLNLTSRCLLLHIGYGLHGFTPDMVEETKEDMLRAGTCNTCLGSTYLPIPKAASFTPSTPPQRAVEEFGLLTPGLTPSS
ncbi:hypothetical protein EJ05DRAFT_198653 [Pseudovirgaria hyperparasitica]|uniref:Cyclin N-terminal domain-containing protein n=1 Tax=Pseudovirgaria hyperparasitica TaxID=470096 RepID=A0A6A6WJT4_9PEZI|nr:uncharacterized protein EJ05DRAFT_198653 [Pseudovirgaria hyperparasitica]KAF2762137.1 hypothetical protein EJ05DRAFT_198653 [Pseudovirgaria hyperparasitica]